MTCKSRLSLLRFLIRVFAFLFLFPPLILADCTPAGVFGEVSHCNSFETSASHMLQTTTVSHGEQKQHQMGEEVRYGTSTLEVDTSARLVVTGDADLFGLRICGSGDVDLEVMGDLIGGSPQDMTREELKESHMSFSVNLGSLGDPVEAVSSLSGTGFGSNKRHRLDVAVSAAGQSGIMPEGRAKVVVHQHLQQTDFPIEGEAGTSVSARTRTIERQPEIHEYSESSNVMGQLLRAFTATMGLVQEVQQLADHLAPEPEPLQRELYQALEEEGVDPTASMEIMADPEVREVVEEVQQYVDRQILRQQKGKGRAVEPVRSPSLSSSSAAAVSSAVDTLTDVTRPSRYVLSTEALAKILRVEMMGGDSVSSRLRIVKRQLSRTVAFADSLACVPNLAFAHGDIDAGAMLYAHEHPVECSIATALMLVQVEKYAFAGLQYLASPLAKIPGVSAAGTAASASVSAFLRTVAKGTAPLTGPIRSAFATVAQKMGLREAITETGELYGFVGAEVEGLMKTSAPVQAHSRINRELLHNQLAIEQLLGETASQGGETIIQGLGDVPRLVSRYGGEASDWVKKRSLVGVELKSGTRFRIHWFENVKTGQRVELKLKMKGG